MPRLRGEQHPRRKLTAEDVLTIRSSYVPGTIRMADLARHHHVSTQTVSTILNGKTWQHLEQGISL